MMRRISFFGRAVYGGHLFLGFEPMPQTPITAGVNEVGGSFGHTDPVLDKIAATRERRPRSPRRTSEEIATSARSGNKFILPER
jgi:hypothetical protein